MSGSLKDVHAALYETAGDGSFCEPSDELAQFFLGPTAVAADLASRKVGTFYVIPEQRTAFLARLRRAAGQPWNDYVLLNLDGAGGGKAWCRCRSVWRIGPRGEDRYSGLIVRIGENDDWALGQLLARMSFAYLRVTPDSRIIYASSHDADHIGIQSPLDLVGQPWAETHWADKDACKAFLEEAWNEGAPEHSQIQRLVTFQGRRGEEMRVQLEARVLDPDLAEARVLEVVWRDVLEEDARLAALQLREQTERLGEFEGGVARAAADLGPHKAAAFYRFHEGEQKYILRSVRGLPDSVQLPRVHQVSPDADRSLQVPLSSGPRRPWAVEFFIPVQGLSRVHVGALWVPWSQGTAVPQSLLTFAKYLGAVVLGAETQAAQRAKNRALDDAVKILLSPDPSVFYESFLKRLLKELNAEAGSIFVVETVNDERCLVLKESTGIIGEDPSRWASVTYRFGEGLTGSMAANTSRAVSLLDVAAVREALGHPQAKYVEQLSYEPVAWLGCPVRGDGKEVIAYLRVVNRKVTRKDRRPNGGFSAADIQIIEALANIMARFHRMEALLSKHQDVLVQSFHELLAPMVAIRNHAHYLKDHVSDPVAPIKAANIEADAELLLDVTHTIETMSHDRAPRLELTDLYRGVIKPLEYGLRKAAQNREYKSLQIKADSLRKAQVNVDKAMMRQVFYNLIINAIKYGPDDGRDLIVGIEASFQQKTCVIHVSDWGMGISEGDRVRIFDAYVRADEAARRDPTGSGIGLFVVRRILQKHGGSISVTKYKDPTTFRLEFPM